MAYFTIFSGFQNGFYSNLIFFILFVLVVTLIDFKPLKKREDKSSKKVKGAENANVNQEKVYDIRSLEREVINFHVTGSWVRAGIFDNTDSLDGLEKLASRLRKENKLRDAIEIYNIAEKVAEIFNIAEKVAPLKLNEKKGNKLSYSLNRKKGNKLSYIFIKTELYISLKEYDKAIAETDKAIQSNPKDLFFRRIKGWLNIYKGDVFAACREWKQAKRLGSNCQDLIDKYCIECQNKITDSYILFFDVETTGIPRDINASFTKEDNWPRIVQISWLIYDTKGNLLYEDDFIIKPDNYIIPESVVKIHGITNERASVEGYDIREVLLRFNEVLEKAQYIVAHNLEFDEKIIKAELHRLALKSHFETKNKICTMSKTTDFCKLKSDKGYKYPKLSELYYRIFNTSYSGAHNSLSDTKALAKCFWKLVELKVISIITPEKNQRHEFNDFMDDPFREYLDSSDFRPYYDEMDDIIGSSYDPFVD